MNEIGIHKVKDILERFDSDESINEVVKIVKGIGKKSCQKWYTDAKSASPGSCPQNIDYTLAQNPYEARYGTNWKKNARYILFIVLLMI